MRIALSGYGKMGKIIETLGNAEHEFSLKIDSSNQNEFNEASLANMDVVIDFSTPEVAFHNIKIALNAGVPVVSGTTGWLNRFDEIKKICSDQDGAFLYASNFSIGVNLFFALNQHLSKLMSSQPDYQAQIIETHHTEKLDAPSGTAITLANDIIENQKSYTDWIKGKSDESEKLSVISNRVEHVPGTHEIKYHSQIDDIIIKHKAHSREGFAKGAILAAQWIQGKVGCYTMQDVLKIKS